MTTLQLLADLMEKFGLSMKEANKAAEGESFGLAWQHLETAKDWMTQMREVGFQAGNEELVTLANKHLAELHDFQMKMQKEGWRQILIHELMGMDLSALKKVRLH